VSILNGSHRDDQISLLVAFVDIPMPQVDKPLQEKYTSTYMRTATIRLEAQAGSASDAGLAPDGERIA
jgi:hypothetical protein